MRILGFVILSLMISGCLTVRDKNGDSAVEAGAVNVLGQDTEIFSSGPISWDERPNSYRVQFSKSNPQSFVYRTNLRTQEKVLLETRSEVVDDDTVISGESYFYQEADQMGRSLRSLEVRIPQDLVINSDLQINSNTQVSFHRIFLGSQARVQFNQFEVAWSADRIYIEPGAQVFAFPEGATAPQGVSGKDGGVFKMKARKISGALQLFMNGENGGRGHAATIPKLKVSDVCTRDTWMPEAPGGMGFPGGDAAQFQIVTEVPGELLVIVKMNPGKGGIGGDGTPEISPEDKWRGPARDAQIWCEWGLRKGSQGPEGSDGKSQLSLFHDGPTIRYYP
ncbi:MAG: hypothetical protein LW875_11200 [Proteobacteria bacterium]|jgi:hypothetical protein|nr:hypothetical protein [Pseudomonadota bacterium]